MDKIETNRLTLRVSEALDRDIGHGVARIEQKHLAELGAKEGDIIQILGKRPTVAKLVPTYVEDFIRETIQIDCITRENAGIGLDETVQIERIDCKRAANIVLAPIAQTSTLAAENDSSRIGRLMEGMAVTSGDKIRVTLFDKSYQEFSVIDATPKGAVVIHSSTLVKIENVSVGGTREPKVTYKDIGGLHRELQKIREMIELPLKHPEVFDRLGIGAPKGVLLHGPPGCGKTLIARAVAGETDAHFYHISGPEIFHKFYGESESHLRDIFETAEKEAPSIIFMDEIDAIASKREEIRGDQQVERRVVAQLLALLDGLKSRGKVIVIGATNIPNVIDPALRRPGRFDRELSISVPDKQGRLEILQIHTRRMPLAADVDIKQLAEITHGFVGADLEALSKEAAMITLRKIMPSMEFKADYVLFELPIGVQVTMGDFMEALKEVEPSAMREVFTEIPDVKWSDVGGLEEIKQVLKETIEWPIKYPELFRQASISPAKGVLLTGPPGTGKTLLAQAVASESGVNFISIKGPALLATGIGESERGIREIFQKAKQASPCILFFDEIDAIAPRRSASSDSHTTEQVISQLLTEMDGIEELKGVTILAASNRPDIIDPALLRSGRFDFRLDLPVPDEKMRLEIFKVHTRNKPLGDDVDLGELAKLAEGWVGSDIEAASRIASIQAIREFIKSEEKDITKFKTSARHFRNAMETIRKTNEKR